MLILSFLSFLDMSPTLFIYIHIYIYIYTFIIIYPINNNKVLPRLKYCNSQLPLPFPIDLSPITHVKALPE
ncbi:hypothetical protein HanXRQr2_Chr01g0003921 [Helianthus annuus]|uniref:Uncharacterized protein n=1 Tax=Helianthus annuus TaxID=4232 RepID=A0A9K3JSS5_HELAN|nr:hypothetical protein HanXRQr2_Chr01g0003921 [Helianthus annuus]